MLVTLPRLLRIGVWRRHAPIERSAAVGHLILGGVRKITSRDAERKSAILRGAGLSLKTALDSVEYMEDTRERLSTPRSRQMNEATTAIKQHVERQAFDDAWALYTQEECPDTVLQNLGLHLCAKARWFKRAAHIWETMAEKTVVSYSAMIDVCGRCKQLEFAEQVFEQLKAFHSSMDMISYNSMVNAYAMCEQPHKALQLFRAIPDDVIEQAGLGAKHSGFVSVMMALARSGDYAQTREIFVQMTGSGIAPQHAHFTALLTACMSKCYTKEAQGCFDLMASYNLQPNLAHWTSLLRCHRYDLARCLEIIEEMANAGIKPSPLTYQGLLKAHVLANDGPGARALLASQKGNIYDGPVTQRLIAQAYALP
ncbi:unnamed protein product [Prorocentrum cordatum]|uniref:PROP1-like PPR domain-containing protein n=1 Tax=Prorocentrum cordatum TaxID=2364126 RepID=A0ABN9VUR6_9DINO|nr:unnamed protein product [Polarella glacialis]